MRLNRRNVKTKLKCVCETKCELASPSYLKGI